MAQSASFHFLRNTITGVERGEYASWSDADLERLDNEVVVSVWK